MNRDAETTQMLSDSAQRYASDHYDFQQRRAVLRDPAGYSAQAWRDYAELGWLALRLPESHGGMEADAVAIGAMMEVVGSGLLMEPIFASAVVCAGVLVRQESTVQQAEWLRGLADGSLKFAYANADASDATCVLRGDRLDGGKVGVLHGDIADLLIVVARDAGSGESILCVADPTSAQVERKSYRLIDGRGAANIRFTGQNVRRLAADRGPSSAAVIAEICDEAAVALCAEAFGIVRRLVAATCEYLKVRKQFGKPIGANQALQHRAVDMFLLQQEIAALTLAAQRALAKPATERVRVVSGARAYIIPASRQIANEAVQMHGGVGITDDLDVSHYFRRLMVNAALFGNRDEHFSRFVDGVLANG